MLLKVLNENCEVRFMDYGTIVIPGGTKVDDKDYEDPRASYCRIDEFDWLDEKYPHQSRKMKADAIAHGIAVPKEKLAKALRVRFEYGDSGYCRDIYRAINKEYKFCRMESRIKEKVEWLTLTPDWEEPDCPLRTGLLIQVTDNRGRVIACEQQEKVGGESMSEKVFPFSWEKPRTKEEELLMDLIYNT